MRARQDERGRVEELDTASRQPRAAQTQNIPSPIDTGAEALGLRGDLLEFVNIPLARFAQCKDFFDDHSNVLRTDTTILFTAASRAKQAGNITLAKRCVQRLVLIRACKDETRESRGRYFENLSRKSSDQFKKFHDACDVLERRLGSDAQPRGEPAAPSSYAANAEYSSASARPPTSFPSPASTRPALDRSNSRQSASAFRSRRDTLNDPGDPTPPVGHPPREGRRMSVRTIQTQYPPTADGGRNAEFRPDNTAAAEPGRRTLDPRYKMRTGGECTAFFVAGRVISVILYSSMGAQSKPSNQTPLFDPYGEPIYSGPRRMIIVQPRQGYSVCVPISTHGQRGIASKSLSRKEQQAHAIVYAEGSETPTSLDGEPEFEKQPIAVRLRSNQTLIISSRIHFGKYHTVEHNVKVMDVGRVTEKSMPAFEAYCRQELLSK